MAQDEDVQGKGDAKTRPDDESRTEERIIEAPRSAVASQVRRQHQFTIRRGEGTTIGEISRDKQQ